MFDLYIKMFVYSVRMMEAYSKLITVLVQHKLHLNINPLKNYKLRYWILTTNSK